MTWHAMLLHGLGSEPKLPHVLRLLQSVPACYSMYGDRASARNQARSCAAVSSSALLTYVPPFSPRPRSSFGASDAGQTLQGREGRRSASQGVVSEGQPVLSAGLTLGLGATSSRRRPSRAARAGAARVRVWREARRRSPGQRHPGVAGTGRAPRAEARRGRGQRETPSSASRSIGSGPVSTV